MRDRREEILARLEVLLPQLQMEPSIATVLRNHTEIPVEQRPGIIILDADEEPEVEYARPVRGLGKPPDMVRMSPQLFYLAGNLAENDTVGTHLNRAKRLMWHTILYDSELKSIISSHGKITFGGFFTDLKTGSAMQGEGMLVPRFSYPLLPTELV